MVSQRSPIGNYFFLIVILIYLIIFLIKPEAISPSLKFFINLLKTIIPVFIIVFILIALINYFIEPKTLVKHLGKSVKAKGWIISIITGIISTGPIYMWYPLLSDLQKHKIRNGFIAAFLYCRAIKPALLPIMIFYFGLQFTIILTIVMIIMSILQGYTLEKIMEVTK